MITKEEIQAKIDTLIWLFSVTNFHSVELREGIVNYELRLQEQLLSAKSIKDLQREVFNAAKLTYLNPNFDLDEDDRMYIPVYDDFDDYFKSISNG